MRNEADEARHPFRGMPDEDWAWLAETVIQGVQQQVLGRAEPARLVPAVAAPAPQAGPDAPACDQARSRVRASKLSKPINTAPAAAATSSDFTGSACT